MSPSDFEPASLLSNTKLIIGIAAFLVAMELIWAFWYLNKSHSSMVTSQVGTPTVATPAPNTQPTSLSLSSDKSIVRVGDKFTVSINVSSAKLTDGVDAIIDYDPARLTVIPSSVKYPVLTTQLYSFYPYDKVDDKSGKIYLSGISNFKPVIPNGSLGTIQFQARALGPTILSFEFTKGATNESNVVETKTVKNVLDMVNNLSLNIES